MRRLSNHAFLLSLPRVCDFLPGQCISLTTSEDLPPRSYSIASGRSDSTWDILFDVVPGGRLTPRLGAARPGDTLYVSPPFGEFRDEGGPSVWIATGTGIAPFVSMVRTHGSAGKRLIHGSRSLTGLFFLGDLQRTMGESYVPCCSAESAEGVFRGRVTAYLSRSRVNTAARYLLCGSAEMVVEVRDLLLAGGVPFSQIGAEIYF